MNKQVLGLLALTVVILVIGAYVSFGLNGKGTTPIGPRGASAFASSISNAKQLGLALIMYSTDYDDLMPPNMGNVRYIESVTNPYMKNPSLWNSYNPAGARFITNEELSLVPSVEIVDPALATMVYENKDWSDGRRIVAYADSHAKGVTGFDPAVNLKVDLTQKGKDFVAKAKASTLPPATDPAGKPLGMPGK